MMRVLRDDVHLRAKQHKLEWKTRQNDKPKLLQDLQESPGCVIQVGKQELISLLKLIYIIIFVYMGRFL